MKRFVNTCVGMMFILLAAWAMGWPMTAPAAVIDISNAKTPAESSWPDGGVNIDDAVGAGNTGKMVGITQTYWGSGGFSVPLDLNGNTLIIDAGWNTPRYATGAISGNGAVVISSNPDLHIDGSTGNTYTGTTTISGASVTLSKTSGDALCSGPITMNAGVNLIWAANDQISDSSDVALVGSGAVLNLAGHSDTIQSLALDAGTFVQTGPGTNGLLRVDMLVLGGVTNTTGAFGVDTPGGYVQGAGYILVGGTPPPVITDPPAEPSAPVPTNGATGVTPLDLSLDWADCARAASYDVYIWLATEARPATPTAAGLGSSQYTLTTILASVTAYKWQVEAINVIGTNASPEWTFTTRARGDISNATTPWEPASPDLGVNIDYVVGAGNTGRLVGTTQTYWGSDGFSVPLDLNGNTLIIDAGWNTPRYATGAISGNGAVVISSNPDLYIDGSTGNTYTGTTTISDASVTLSKTSGDALCSGPITMNAKVNLIWAANDQISDSSDVSLVGSGAVLNLAGHSDTIHGLSLDTGTSVDTGAGGVLTVTNLIVAGVTNAPGTYDSGNSSFVTGSGRVIVVSTLSKPEAPTGLTATAGAAQVDLLWNAGLNATGYLVQRSLTSNAFSTVVGGTADVNATNFTDTAVTNGVLYWYVVTSTNAAGESANSAPVSARPLPAVLPQPAFKSDSDGYVLHLDSGTATFTFDVMGGLQYRVESTEDLTPPITWTPIPGGWYPAVSNGTMQLSDPDATGTQRFYRIAVEVQP